MQKVLMYSTGYCPFCMRAEMLLKQRGVQEIEKVRIDAEPEAEVLSAVRDVFQTHDC